MARSPKTPSSQHRPVAPVDTEWDSFVESANETRHRFGQLYERVERQATAEPVRVMGWAMAAGFVLGGGVFSGLTLRAARVSAAMTLRAAGIALLARRLFKVSPLVERLAAVEVGKPT